ncbi:hypothetical protein EDC94DRAFT_600895, partial [Helicostylum pulchrum]
MAEDRLTDRLNQERITTRLQKQEIQKLEAQNHKLQKKLGEVKQQLLKREQEIQEEEEEILQREEEVKEQYASIKACLNGNIKEKIDENAELKQELQAVKIQKEQLEGENILLRDTSQNLQTKVNELTSTLTEKTNTIANLNMIVKLQATRIEGFMADNAHHLEQNLKLNRLIEANSKTITPEQKSSYQIQRSINTILTKPLNHNMSSSLPEHTYTLFDHVHPADTKAIKRPLDESTSAAAISKSNQRSTTYNSPVECSRGPTATNLNSPELGDSPYSCADFDNQSESAVIFDVSLTPHDAQSPSEQNERSLVYLDESSFENTLSSPPRLKSMSPPDTNARVSPLMRRPSQSSDIQRRISLLDEAQKRSSALHSSSDNQKKNSTEEMSKRSLYSKGITTRPSYSTELPRRLSVCDENDVPDAVLKDEIPTNDSRQPLTNATNILTTQKPITLKTGQ